VEVQEPDDAPLREGDRKGFQLVELAGRVAAAHHGPDGATGDHVRDDPGLGEDPDHADMGPPAGSAAAEGEPDLHLRARVALHRNACLRGSPAAPRPGAAPGDPVPQHDRELQGLTLMS
jgi:hypothetical protein